jgi:tRNA threonylcarbamoyladenosine biosynthesis protein TsaB
LKILAIDTATATCSVAIGHDNSVVSEILRDRGKTHASMVMNLVDQALSAAGMKTKDIDAYAVTVGPGSFTGLRIGLAAVKGLAFSHNKPIAGIMSLDALAAPIPASTADICAMIDARRGEVYAALYRWDAGRLISRRPPEAVSPETVLAEITGPTIFVGDGAVAYRNLILSRSLEGAVLATTEQHMLRASVVARLGMDRILSGQALDAFRLMPVYLRKSDAHN